MFIRIRLGDEDRAELGAPEVLEFDPLKVMLSEAEQLEAAGIDWLRIRHGEAVLDDAGKPATNPESGLEVRRYGPGVQRVWIWLALRRAGIEIGVLELDVDIDAAAIQFIRPVVEGTTSPGKAEPARGKRAPSATKSRTTRPSSGTSSRASRATKSAGGR